MSTVLRDTSVVGIPGPNTSSIPLALNTNGVNRLAVLFVYCPTANVTSITSSGSLLTWTLRNNNVSGFQIWTAPILFQRTNETITVNLSGSISSYSLILSTLYVSGSGSIPVYDSTANAAFTSTASPSSTITTVASNADILAFIYFTTAPGSTITPGSGFSIIADGSFISTNYIKSELSNADLGGSGSNPYSFGLSSALSGNIFAVGISGSVPVMVPTGVTATYVAGIGITVTWTTPAGFSGTGYNVYRVSNAGKTLLNGTLSREQNSQPGVFIPTGTTTFTDTLCGYPALNTGDNIYTYYVTSVSNGMESVLSIASSPVTFLG